MRGTRFSAPAALAVCAVMLRFLWPDAWMEASVGLVLVTALPSRRGVVMGLLALFWAGRFDWYGYGTPWSGRGIPFAVAGYRAPWLEGRGWALALAAPAAALLLLGVLYRFHRVLAPWVRRHLLGSIAGGAAVVLLAASFARGLGPTRVWGLAAVAIFAHFFWYALRALKADLPATRGFLPFVGLSMPFWSETYGLSYMKDAPFAESFQASGGTEEEACRLEGLRLLAWALVVQGCLNLLTPSIVHLGLPQRAYALALERAGAGAPLPWQQNWIVLFWRFSISFLTHMAWAFSLTGVARLAGFRVPPVMDAPWKALTIGDFWNRYDVYFRFLMMDLFFYPVFLRLHKVRDRWRIPAAIFAAVGAGNVLFHGLRDFDFIATAGVLGAVQALAPYAVYCLILGLAVSISHLRPARAAPSTAAGRFAARAAIFLFYCLISVFDEFDRATPLRPRLLFLAGLLP